jgi:spermidine/putrescine transport system permease protein
VSIAVQAGATPSGVARRRRRLAVVLLAGPVVLIIGGALAVPTIVLLFQSFLVSLGFGQVEYTFTLSNYTEALTDPLLRSVALHSFGQGALVATACLILGYPVAFFITFRLTKAKNLALFLVVVSLFTSYLVRLYAWYTILGRNGVINTALRRLGLGDQPLTFLLFSRWAVLIAFVNIFLPFTVLILASSMQNIRGDVLENARDLGASPFRTFTKVVLPLTITGAVAAFVYTFILTSGDYITPALLGGKQGTTLATIVSNQFVALGNQPSGAAISFLMLVIFFAVYFVLSQLERFKGF